MPDTFVWIYHPQLGNRQAYVPLSSVDDHAARGWLLVDPGVTPPAPTVPYTTVAQVASQLSTGTGPIGLAGRASSVAAVEDATTVAPTGAWDFTQAPTVAGAPIGGGSGGGPVTAANITDATTVGRSLLTAPDAAAARSAIGAGTSNLAVGTTASTAKAGNYTPPVADLPAGTTLTVQKSGAVWPARPTARADITVAWKGADPSPANGVMLDNVDYRLVTP